jgi:hypothetical protein
MAGGSNKENKPAKDTAARSRAKWNATCDAILVTTLKVQKVQGNQTDNAGWKSDAFTAAERALAGSEKQSGGAKKTAKACSVRWGAVWSDFIICKVIAHLCPILLP